jgi:DNA replication initiation complex subunit (GINS family)
MKSKLAELESKLGRVLELVEEKSNVKPKAEVRIDGEPVSMLVPSERTIYAELVETSERVEGVNP